MKKTFASIIASFAMASALPAQAQERETMPHIDGGTVEVVSMGQHEAMEIYRQIVRETPFDPRTEGVTSAQYRQHLMMEFERKVRQNLMEDGVPLRRARAMSQALVINFHLDFSLESGAGFDYAGPGTPLNGIASIPSPLMSQLGELHQVETGFCTVGLSDGQYDARAWFSDFLHEAPQNLSLYGVQEAFSDEFQAFTNAHEKAHCAGADEPAADYIAAISLLRAARGKPHMRQTLDFLETMTAIRIYDQDYGKSNERYAYTARALIRAVIDFQANRDLFSDDMNVQRLAQQDFSKTEITPARYRSAINNLRLILPAPASRPQM